MNEVKFFKSIGYNDLYIFTNNVVFIILDGLPFQTSLKELDLYKPEMFFEINCLTMNKET